MLGGVSIVTAVVVLLGVMPMARGTSFQSPAEELLREVVAAHEWRRTAEMEGEARLSLSGETSRRLFTRTHSKSRIVRDGDRAIVRASVLADSVAGKFDPSARWRDQVAVFVDGKAYEWDVVPGRRRTWIRYEPEGRERAMLTLRATHHLGALFGDSVAAGSAEGGNVVDALIADPSSATIIGTERTGAHDCHVVKGPAPGGGSITLWIDRATRALVRWRVEKGREDAVRGRSLADFYPGRTPVLLREEFTLVAHDVVEGATIVPREGRYHSTVEFEDGTEQVSEGTLTLSQAKLNLTKERADQLIRVDLPDGSLVSMRPELSRGKGFEWRGGTVVPLTEAQMIAALTAGSAGRASPGADPPARTWIPWVAFVLAVLVIASVAMWKHRSRGNAGV